MTTTALRPDTLTDSEVSTITNGLRVAAERYTENADEFTKLAAALRAGHTMALWAEGEPGALAADRLADQFTRQADESRALIERLDDACSLTINPWED